MNMKEKLARFSVLCDAAKDAHEEAKAFAKDNGFLFEPEYLGVNTNDDDWKSSSDDQWSSSSADC